MNSAMGSRGTLARRFASATISGEGRPATFGPVSFLRWPLAMLYLVASHTLHLR